MLSNGAVSSGQRTKVAKFDLRCGWLVNVNDAGQQIGISDKAAEAASRYLADKGLRG